MIQVYKITSGIDRIDPPTILSAVQKSPVPEATASN